MYKYEGSWKQSTIYVRNNNGGSPGTTTASANFTPSSNGWYTVNFTTPPSYDTDFFLILALGESGSGYMETSIGLDNNGGGSGRNVASEGGVWSDPTQGGMATWYTGDFMIRAEVNYVGIEEANAKQATELKILPNPIVDKGLISFACSEQKEVSLRIFDLSGTLVRTLVNGVQNGGLNKVEWDKKDNNGNTVSSGMYFCKLRIGNNSVLTKTLVVL